MSSLVIFFSLAYVVAWIFFIPVALFSGNSSDAASAAMRQILILPGVFAPALVAIVLTARSEGSEGLRVLLSRVLQWQVGARWFVFSVGYFAAIKLAVAVIHRIATGAWPQFGHTPWYVMVAAIAVSTPVQAGEEIGWRGYALPRLSARVGLAWASVILGVIWACWHLPLFFVRAGDTYGQSFFVYAVQVTALSVAFAWLYVHTNQSLLLVMLLHASVNNTLDIVPSAVPGAMNTFGLSTSLVAWFTVAVLWACAAYFLIRMPKGQLEAT